MSFISVAAKNVILRLIGVITIAAAATVAVGVINEFYFLHAQLATPAAPSKVRLPDEVAGIDDIARALISAFDQVNIVAPGEDHRRKLDSDLRIAVVRHPDFARKVRFIVVEFDSTAEQSTLDRYIRGDNVPRAQLERVWKTTSQPAVWESPVYAEFFGAVRDVNMKLPAAAQVRVLAGDPPAGSTMSRDASALAVLKEQVLQKGGKALVIYGSGHFYRTVDYPESIGIARPLEIDIGSHGSGLPGAGSSAYRGTKWTCRVRRRLAEQLVVHVARREDMLVYARDRVDIETSTPRLLRRSML